MLPKVSEMILYYFEQELKVRGVESGTMTLAKIRAEDPLLFHWIKNIEQKSGIGIHKQDFIGIMMIMYRLLEIADRFRPRLTQKKVLMSDFHDSQFARYAANEMIGRARNRSRSTRKTSKNRR